MSGFWYYLCATLFVLLNVGALAANLLTLPGNWFIVLLSVLFAIFVHRSSGDGLNWWCVGAVAVLALLAELIEFVAGAAGAAKSGGSRRGMVLAMVGAMLGSIVGTFFGFLIPIPVVGNLIGAVAGGCLGAFLGAYAGEAWKGRGEEQRLAVSTAALVGRLFGTVGKLGIGAVMVVVTAADAFFFN